MAEISDYLKGLNEQKVQVEKEIVVVKNPVLDLICTEYELWLAKIQRRKSHPVQLDDHVVYNHAIKSVGKIQFSANDVRSFSIILQQYQDDVFFCSSGMFLSALINCSNEQNFEVITTFLRKQINGICYEQKKGEVKVLGDAPGSAKKMSGGSLSISGNADHSGIMMTGGKLSVAGNLSNGGPVFGGEVYVEGENCSVSYASSKATIYHKIKRIR